MAIIYSYPLNDDIKPLDELVGTTEKNINGQLKTVTRNFLLQDLAEFFIVDGGLQKTIILTTVGDSGAATLDQVTGILNIPEYAGLQNLQQVTDLGNVTSNSMRVELANSYSQINVSNIGTENTTLSTYAYLRNNGSISIKSGAVESNIKNTSVTNSDVILEFPNKTSGSYTIATTSDVIVQNLQQVTDVGASTTNAIYISGITNDYGLVVETNSTNYPSIYVDNNANGTNANTISAFSLDGITANLYSQNGAGIRAESISGIPIIVFGNGSNTPSIDVNLGNTNKGLVIDSGTSSTGNFIDLNKNGVNKLTVNQAGEITAAKFIKIGGTGTNVLLDDGSTVALSSIGGNQNLQEVTDEGATTTNRIQITLNSNGEGLYVYNGSTGTGIYGQSNNGIGVYGYSINDAAVYGFSENGIAIKGYAESDVVAEFETTASTANIVNFKKEGVLKAYINNSGEFTAQKLIKEGGFDNQFLKADGSVDNNTYLTSADLPSTLDLYATTSPDPVISGYTALVRNITDSRYNTVAVDVPTPTITGTIASPTFCGAVISDPSVLLGNPGVFNFSVIGKIRRTGGSTSSGADFFFSIYKRDTSGIETLIADSSPVVVPANGGVYVEYISIALWNNGIFLSTDRVVLKFYGIKTGGGSGATYEFLFGGADPVRGTAAISSAIIPNIYLRDLADVEKTDALNNEVLYWNDADSLWEHSLVVDLTPDASATQKGLVTTGTQTFAGDKTFNGTLNLANEAPNTIASLDASRNLIGLETDTYPDLNELSQLKGVTSSVQTQFSGKQPLNANLTSLSGLTHSGGVPFVRMYAPNLFSLDTNTYLTSAVTTLSGGTTGLTPNTATQGAIILSGTLVAANGGTGQSSYTVGDILYASTSTALSKLAGVATGNSLISGGAGVAPSWGKIGLSTHVSGNLPVTNLNSGTGATSSTYWRGDGTWATVSGGSGTVTSVSLTLGTTGSDLSSVITNGTTNALITLNVPDAGATARGVITTGIQTIAGVKTFSASPKAPTPTIGTNDTTVATTEFVNASIPGNMAYNIIISSFPSNAITTETTGTSNGVSYPQDGRNVMISNGATAITITANTLSTKNDFIASYTKVGTAAITFQFTGTGATIVEPSGRILSGSQGSTALLTKNGNIFYLLINNLP